MEFSDMSANESATSSSKKRRRNTMPHAEKVKLIDAIKIRACIWDKTHPKHSDTNAVNASWREIAAELGKSGTNNQMHSKASLTQI